MLSGRNLANLGLAKISDNNWRILPFVGSYNNILG
jgi:hypothetical protein